MVQEKEISIKEIENVKKSAYFMGDKMLMRKLFGAEVKLNNIINIETEGVTTRSRRQWTEEGDISTKIFL